MSEETSFYKLREALDRSHACSYFSEKDLQMIKVFEWIKSLEAVYYNCAELGMGKETILCLEKLINMLKKENSLKVYAVFCGLFDDEDSTYPKEEQDSCEYSYLRQPTCTTEDKETDNE